MPADKRTHSVSRCDSRHNNKGFRIVFNFGQPLIQEDIQKNNRIGHWLNEKFIVRLCALLESYDIRPERKHVDNSTNGSNEMYLVKRLRDVIAHSSGRYNINDKRHRHRKLMKELVSYFNLSDQARKEFPLPIDTVLNPLFQGCKKYVQGKYDMKQEE